MNKLLRLLLENNSFSSLNKFYVPTDNPSIYNFYCKFYSRGIINSREQFAYGASLKSAEVALLKCLMEFFEELCSLNIPNIKQLYFEKFNNIQANAIDPSLFNNNFNIRRTSIGWIKGFDIENDKPCYIPAQLIFYKYLKLFKETPILQPKLNTGNAAGIDKDRILLHGLYEIIERDAFMTTFLNKIPLMAIDLKSVNEIGILRAFDSCIRYKLELHSFVMTNDLGIPSFLTLIIDKTGSKPILSCGLKSGFNEKNALLGSIEEALMARLHNINFNYNTYLKPGFENESLGKRYSFWSALKSLEQIAFLLNQKPSRIMLKNFKGTTADELLMVLNILKRKRIQGYYANITDSSLNTLGIKVFKVIIPKLQPLFYDEKDRVIRQTRMKETVEFFGKKSKELNEIPIPLL